MRFRNHAVGFGISFVYNVFFFKFAANLIRFVSTEPSLPVFFIFFDRKKNVEYYSDILFV